MASRTRAIEKIAAATAGTLLTLSLSACTSSATTDEPFAVQARAAHLTRAQDRALRAEVVKYLGSSGGRQVSLNEIDLNGIEKIKVAIPGEAYPRDFVNNPAALPSPSPDPYDAATTTPSSSPCYHRTGSGYFCGFSGVNYTGTETDTRLCSTSPLANFVRTGTPIGTGTPFDVASTVQDLKDPNSDWTTIPC